VLCSVRRRRAHDAYGDGAVTAIRMLAAGQSILIRDGIAPEAVRFEQHVVRATPSSCMCRRNALLTTGEPAALARLSSPR
jgi:hypothetical protein